MPDLESVDWQMRYTVINGLAESGRAPTAAEAGEVVGLTPAAAQASLQRLHDAHLLLLDGRGNVLMAHPFSNVPTGYQFQSGGVGYDANCAWDAFGIPAALQRDGVVTALMPAGHGKARIAVRGGEITGDGGLVHFLLPLRHWYDDLVYT